MRSEVLTPLLRVGVTHQAGAERMHREVARRTMLCAGRGSGAKRSSCWCCTHTAADPGQQHCNSSASPSEHVGPATIPRGGGTALLQPSGAGTRNPQNEDQQGSCTGKQAADHSRSGPCPVCTGRLRQAGSPTQATARSTGPRRPAGFVGRGLPDDAVAFARRNAPGLLADASHRGVAAVTEAYWPALAPAWRQAGQENTTERRSRRSDAPAPGGRVWSHRSRALEVQAPDRRRQGRLRAPGPKC